MITSRNAIALAVAGLLGCVTAASRGADWDDERAARAFNTLDTNGSGGISAAEFRAGADDDDADEMFRRIDADGDGEISAVELRTDWDKANNVLRKDVYKLEGEAQSRIMESAFLSLDTDDDGFLTVEEFQAGVKAGDSRATHEFRRADDNKDGKMDRSEFREDFGRFRRTLRGEVLYPPEVWSAAPRTERQEVIFEALDADSDGYLTMAEYRSGLRGESRAEAQVTFGAMDDNRDGVVSRAELYESWDDVVAALREDVHISSSALGVERRDTEAKEKVEVESDVEVEVESEED